MDDDWGVWAGERDDEEVDEERAVVSSGETAYLAPQGWFMRSMMKKNNQCILLNV